MFWKPLVFQLVLFEKGRDSVEKAARKFDLDTKDYKFATYATSWIKREIEKELDAQKEKEQE